MADFDKINIDAVSYNVKDATARQQIGAETTAREQADSQLSQQISAEQAAREQADTQLAGQIANLDTTPFYNVKKYGAVGDGNTDDTAAIQAAIDEAMTAGGGTVVLPSGTYKVSSTIIIRPHTASDNIEASQNIHFLRMDRLKICGLGDCRIQATGSMDTIIRTNDYTYPGNVGSYSNFYTTIENICFLGTGSTLTGVYLYNALHSRIVGCQIDGCATGLSLYGYGEITIIDCVIRASSVCLYSDHAGDNLIMGCDFYSDSVGIQTYGYSGSTKIIANTFTRNTQQATGFKAIQILPKTGEQNGPYHIIANSFDQVACAVDAYGAADNVIMGVWVVNNKITAANVPDCYLALFTYADNCAVMDNIIGVQNDYDKISSLLAATQCKFLSVRGNTASWTKSTAIWITACTGVITNNAFYNSQQQCIDVSGDSAMEIIGNIFESCPTGVNVNNGVPASTHVVNNCFKSVSTPVYNAGSATVNTDSFVTTLA